MSVSKEQYGDVGKNSLSKRTSHTTERALLRNRGYLLQDTIGEGTYSKVKVKHFLLSPKFYKQKLLEKFENADLPKILKRGKRQRRISIVDCY